MTTDETLLRKLLQMDGAYYRLDRFGCLVIDGEVTLNEDEAARAEQLMGESS